MPKRRPKRRPIATMDLGPFDRVKAISEKSHIRTVLQSLQDVNNDYSDNSRPFKAGDVGFIDLIGPRGALLQRHTSYQQDRQSAFEQLLSDPNADSLSIVIPVAIGRKSSLRECVASIKRQTFSVHQPEKVDLIIVQDGIASNPARNPISDDLIDELQSFAKYKLFRLKPTSMAESNRRSAARNVGIYYGSHSFVFFIDSSMVLEQNFLAEQMLRHSGATGSIALVGFKQNIEPSEYRRLRGRIQDGDELPKYKEDWKWRHGYMHRTNYLRSLSGAGGVGPRYPLTRFCHSGLTSVRLNRVKEVGGFHIGFQAYWGFEDSFLGALLLSWGTKIVPCPSSVAFMIKHREAKKRKEGFDSPRNLAQYKQRLEGTLNIHNSESLERQIGTLWASKTLELIREKPLNSVRRPAQSSPH